MNSPATKVMISARIPEELGERLEALAGTTRRSKAYLLQRALEDYVERHARLERAVADAVKEADASGAYISHEKMSRWMLSLGTENELPPPEPDVFKTPR